MPGTELFGSPLGDRAFAEDAHTRGLTRLQNAEADKAELAVQQERQFAQLMRLAGAGANPVDQMQPGNDDTFGDFNAPQDSTGPRLARLAQLATQAGLVDRGAKLAAQAATINSRYASSRASNAIASLRQIRQRKEEAGLMGSVLEDVSDQDSYDRAMAAYQMATGRMSKFAGLPYSPELVQRLRSQAMSVKDQEAARAREASADSLNAFREERLRQHDEANAISATARGVQRDRQGRLVKIGSGKPLSITQAERDDASALITKDFPEFTDASKNSERRTAATTVASAAKTLMQRNNALSWGEALAQAYTAERGNFRTESKLFGGRKVKFEGGGKTPQSAIPLPKSEEDMREGRYYYNDQGGIGKWTGKGFQPIGGAAPQPQPAAAGLDDTADDDEEE